MTALATYANVEAPSRHAATDSYEYDAFGNSVATSGSTPKPMLYRGEQYDSDLGLYYLRARYYNPTTGRFMSKDQNAGNRWDPKSLHKYLYASGDPVNAIDPMGRETFVEYFANFHTRAGGPGASLLGTWEITLIARDSRSR